MMTKSLLLFLLCGLVLGNTYSYTFSAQATSPAVQPSYFMGSLVKDSTVAITIQIPFPNGKSLSDFVVRVMDQDNTVQVQTLPFSGYTQTVNWIVPDNASYYLKITGTPRSNVIMYYLSVTVNNNVLLRLTDVLRSSVYKYFYVSPTDSGTVIITGPSSITQLTLLTMNTVNQFLMAGSQTLIPIATSGGYNTYTVTHLSSGYYTLIIQTSIVVSVTVTFQGSSYPCPYNSQFADYYSIFMGCLSSSSNKYNGLPCTAFDPSTFDCTACLNGYALKNGICTLDVQCGPREYIHFGTCYSVNSDCDQFDFHTGACVTCLTPTSIVVNGLCVPNDVSLCANGTHLYNGKCIVDSCAAVNSAGVCTACTSRSYYLSNGTCKAIDCGQGNYFSTIMNNCTSLPVDCANFDTLTQTCKDCSHGYFKNPLENNTCEKPDYSINCERWDFQNNRCQVCMTGYIWNIYTCIISIANNCEPGQVIIQNQCVNLPDNCLSVNNYRICTQCAYGYQMVAGVCVKCAGPNPYYPCVTCPFNQYVDATGVCKNASPYCSTINQSTGLCNSCTSGAPPVSGICCSSGQQVVNGVCQNKSNSSSDPSTVPKKNFAEYYRYCLYYSPTQKTCTQCLNGRYFDYADHCA